MPRGPAQSGPLVWLRQPASSAPPPHTSGERHGSTSVDVSRARQKPLLTGSVSRVVSSVHASGSTPSTSLHDLQERYLD